jgi:hypothetical protein
MGIGKFPDIGKFDWQGRVCTVEYTEFILVCVYVPNSGDELMRIADRLKFDAAFRVFLKKVRNPCDHVMVQKCRRLNAACNCSLWHPPSFYYRSRGCLCANPLRRGAGVFVSWRSASRWSWGEI